MYEFSSFYDHTIAPTFPRNLFYQTLRKFNQQTFRKSLTKNAARKEKLFQQLFFFTFCKNLNEKRCFSFSTGFLYKRPYPPYQPSLPKRMFLDQTFFKGLLSRTQNQHQPTHPILLCSSPPSARNAFSSAARHPYLKYRHYLLKLVKNAY